MITAASSPEPATSPTTTPSSPDGSGNTSYQSPPTTPLPVTYLAAIRIPATTGGAPGTSDRCSASTASLSSLARSDCTASAARSAATWSRVASSLVNTRDETEPTCMTPTSDPAASSGTPSKDRTP